MALSDVQAIINHAIATADAQTEKVDSWADASFFTYSLGDALKPTTQFGGLVFEGGIPGEITIPRWNSPGTSNGGDPLNDDIIKVIKDLNQFSVQYGIDAIGPKLSDLFATFLTTFYPQFADADQGMDALTEILANKGYTQPVSAEDAVFQRGRSRVVNDGARSEAEVVASWAARGYQLPPGAMFMQQQMARQNTQDKVATISSDIVVKQAELAVDFYKFAIQETVRYREAAFNNAVQYLQVFTTAVMRGFGADAYAAILDARNRMYSTTVSLYQAMSANRETKARITQNDTNVNLESWKTQLGVLSELTRARSSAAIGAANAVGHVAAAAMSGVNAAASISVASAS